MGRKMEMGMDKGKRGEVEEGGRGGGGARSGGGVKSTGNGGEPERRDTSQGSRPGWLAAIR